VKIVAPPNNPSNKNKNYLAHLKGQSLVKKMLKTASKSTNKQRHKTCSKYTLSNKQRGASENDKNQKTYKHHIFAPTAGVHRTIFPQTLHGDRDRHFNAVFQDFP